MENQQHIVASPIHKPCPDMAGCANPKPELTQNSLQTVRQLRQRFGFKTTAQRIAEQSQYIKYLATFQAGGVA